MRKQPRLSFWSASVSLADGNLGGCHYTIASAASTLAPS